MSELLSSVEAATAHLEEVSCVLSYIYQEIDHDSLPLLSSLAGVLPCRIDAIKLSLNEVASRAINNANDLACSLKTTDIPVVRCPAPTTLGERIHQRRKEFGMPPAVLADMVGVSRKAITMWELGSSAPSSKHIIPLSIALQCEPMWLLAGDADALIADYRLVDNPASAPENNKPAVCDIPTQVMNGVDTAGIGKRIEQRRVELGFTHKQLAERVGVDESTEFLWATGKKVPQSKQMDIIGAALRCSVIWLLTGRGDVEVAHNA